jgi:hypothetical protein
MPVNNDLVEQVSEAIRTEMSSFNADVVAEMSRESGPTELTPFNLLAIAAIRAMQKHLYDIAEEG